MVFSVKILLDSPFFFFYNDSAFLNVQFLIKRKNFCFMEVKDLNISSENKDSIDNVDKSVDDEDFGSLYVKDELFLMLIDNLMKRIPDNKS